MDLQLATLLFKLPTFDVSPLIDPVIPADAHRADSEHVLWFAAPILGPTACLVWHRLARYVSTDDAVAFTPDEFAASFGVMPAVAAKAIARLIHFGIASYTPTGIAVRLLVPPFPSSWQRRLPSYLAAGYTPAAA